MSIGIEPEASAATDASPSGEAFVAELARLANVMFQGGAPTHAPSAPGNFAPSPNGASPAGVSVPPNPGPSALAPGARGVSTAQNGPPTPGFLVSPPLASAPPPKEADLRSVGALVADPLQTQPVRLAETPTPSASDSTPYFLALAGLPSASSLPPQ